jgi:hypothetical protein
MFVIAGSTRNPCVANTPPWMPGQARHDSP